MESGLERKMKICAMKHNMAAFRAASICFEEDFRALVAILLLLKEKKRKKTSELHTQRATDDVWNVSVGRHLTDKDTKFREYFRLSPLLFSQVLRRIKEDLEGIATNWLQKPMSARYKLCVTLRYLATGDSFRSLAFQYRVHRTTISRIVDKCLESIIKHFLQRAMPTPTTAIFQKIIDDYFEKWNFPNCCGAIDGKHIKIKCAPTTGSTYIHSIVLLAIVDANYKFIAVDVDSYGREGDKGIFPKSFIGKLIDEGNFNVPPPTALPSSDVVVPNIMIAGEAFALTEKMLKPYSRQHSSYDQAKAIFNYQLCRARSTTDNAFGIMSSYFRILFTPIDAKIEKIDKIILTASILHNLMRDEKIPCPSEVTFNDTENITLPSGNFFAMSNSIGRPSNDGVVIRDKFKDFFNGVGAPYWQENMISNSFNKK